MDRHKTYDYLVLARKRVFDWIRPIGAEPYGREFPFGQKTLGRTLAHTLASEWYYVQRIRGLAVPPYAEWPYPQAIDDDDGRSTIVMYRRRLAP